MTAPDAELPAIPGRAPVPIHPVWGRIRKWPWWLFIAIGLGLYLIYSIITNELTNRAFWWILGQQPEAIAAGELVLTGILMTIVITLSAYSIAIIIGLIMGLARVSENLIVNNIASFYVEIIRGIPMLVLVYATALVIVPQAINGINVLGQRLVASGVESATLLTAFTPRDVSVVWRGILALAIGYGAFSAEIFRAGIQSVEKGQMEAARALGMSYFQAMRLVILPQAIRRVLPALGNDFVSMLKESSLLSVLGVRELTQLNKLYVNSTFNFVQGFAVLAFLYLTMTVMLSRLVRLMERRMARGTG